MPKVINDGGIEFEDGTPASASQVKHAGFIHQKLQSISQPFVPNPHLPGAHGKKLYARIAG